MTRRPCTTRLGWTGSEVVYASAREHAGAREHVKPRENMYATAQNVPGVEKKSERER